MTRAVFLDRDGVINPMWRNSGNGVVDSPADATQFSLLPGVTSAIAAVNRSGRLAIVISNQPGIARAKFSPAALQAITTRMHAELRTGGARLDAVYYCPHHPDGVVPDFAIRCTCRKPEPGLILQAGREFGVNLEDSFMIGDREKDIEAGQRAGCRTIKLSESASRTDKARAGIDANSQADWTVRSLPDAVALLLNQTRSDSHVV